MAPELALGELKNFNNATVLDPMTGSGTVASFAVEKGHSALAYDLDPLAVLVSKVRTTRLDERAYSLGVEKLERAFVASRRVVPCLHWLDDDEEGLRFVDFWFAEKQREDLRVLAFILSRPAEFEIEPDVADALRVAMSRIIVSKKAAASLAADTSHSRPHRVKSENDYDVLEGFLKSAKAVSRFVTADLGQGSAVVERGDARELTGVQDHSVDLVLTSPPYLNAIDYMRGHRMSLIWLGHKFSDLRQTRRTSIGAERKPDNAFSNEELGSAKVAMGEVSTLPARYQGMIERYLIDLHKMMIQVQRVLKPEGEATFVMGNSRLKGVYVENSEGLVACAKKAGLVEERRHERDLPITNRYLPTPDSGALSKRMRKEVVVTFKPAA